MNKKYRLSKDIATKIIMTAAVQGHTLSSSELIVLKELVLISDGMPMYISSGISADIKQRTGLSESAYSTSLFRLKKKKLIAQDGKTISLNAGFNGLSKLENLILEFSKD